MNLQEFKRRPVFFFRGAFPSGKGSMYTERPVYFLQRPQKLQQDRVVDISRTFTHVSFGGFSNITLYPSVFNVCVLSKIYKNLFEI